MSDDKITAFRKEGRYTDIRIAIREMQSRLPNASQGMIVLFAEDGTLHMVHVCEARDLAFIGADGLYNSFTVPEKK